MECLLFGTSPSRRGPCALALLVFTACATRQAASFHDPHHVSGPVHFSHPLVTESPSPDTKIRLDLSHANQPREDGAAPERNSVRLEAEYAFDPEMSVEVDVPYTEVEPDHGSAQRHLDTVSVALKLAHFPGDDPNLLLGGGVELGLPTGSQHRGIGNNHAWDVETFVDAGYTSGPWEWVGFLSAGMPFRDQPRDDLSDFELGLDLSLMRHLDQRLALLLELNGVHVKGGEEDGLDAWTVTPGLKFQPGEDPSLRLGLGVSLPVTADKETHARTQFSLFKHF